MVYHPRAYDESYAYAFPADGVEIKYTVATAKYCAYYLPGSAPSPKRLWLAFCGNGSLALDWTTILREYPYNGDAFLLIDYPGYGKNGGYATIASTRASADAALKTLRELTKTERRPTYGLHHRPLIRGSGRARFCYASSCPKSCPDRAIHNAPGGSGDDVGQLGRGIADRKL